MVAEVVKMTIWYRAWRDDILDVEAERETEKSLYIKNRRWNKTSKWFCFFKTYEEAKEHLVKGAQQKVDYYTSGLNDAKKLLAKVKGL
jgi:hypothetical protein